MKHDKRMIGFTNEHSGPDPDERSMKEQRTYCIFDKSKTKVGYEDNSIGSKWFPASLRFVRIQWKGAIIVWTSLFGEGSLRNFSFCVQ